MAVRRGVFFIIDALLAIILILLGAIFASMYFTNDPETSQSELLTRDSIDYLGNLYVHDLNTSILSNLTTMSNATRLNATVLEQIGFLWVKNESDAARELSRSIFDRAIPPRYGYAVIVGGKVVYNRSVPVTRALTTAAQMVSGIEEFRPIEGYTAEVFLSASPSRAVSSYVMFGGFTGEGNLSASLILPDNYSKVTGAYFEGAISDNLTIYVNGQFAQNVTKRQIQDDRADNVTFNLSALSRFHPGVNEINISFPRAEGSLGYVGGGYLRVDVNTTASYDPRHYNRGNSTLHIPLPGINGLINLYSSFYVGGTLNSMVSYLHYRSNYSLYNNTNFSVFFTVGGSRVWVDNNVTGDESTFIDDDTFGTYLDYDSLSGKTVPIRLGSSGINYSQSLNGRSDVILITDISGSMVWQLNNSIPGVIRSNCSDPALYNATTRRISLAKCLDKDFINILLNTTGNRVGLIRFDDYANTYVNLTTNRNTLINAINAYPDNPNLGTCICCALNRAYTMLNKTSNSTRDKFVVAMTDGMSGDRCTTLGSCGNSYQGTMTDGDYCCDGSASECNTNACNGPSNNANYSSWRTHKLANATIHAIGFGQVSTCQIANRTLNNVAKSGGGNYYASANATELKQIYENIAYEILNFVYDAQSIVLTGDLIPSRLYPDSYIELNFTPYIPFGHQGEMPVTFELPPFNGNASTFALPPNLSVLESDVTSYSGSRWTSHVSVENGTAVSVPYNLSFYGSDYRLLGDPFDVVIPPDLLSSGSNMTVRVSTASGPLNVTTGSPDDRFIYTILVKTSSSSRGVGTLAEGCLWNITFSDGYGLLVPIPGNITNANRCYYSNASFNAIDAIDNAAYNLFAQLDLDKDGKIDFRFDEESLSTNVVITSGVPYLWGPTLVEVRVWQ